MKCEQVIPLLHAYLDRELDVETEMGVEQHVHECEACAERYAVQRAYQKLLRENLQTPTPPPQLQQRIRRQLYARPAARSWFRTWSSAWVAVGAMAIMVFAIMLRVYTPMHEGVGHPVGKGEKYVYHIDEAGRASDALTNIRFHLKETPGAHIVVVTHNQGVDFLLHGAKDAHGNLFEPRVASLVAEGVEFRVCHNTLNVRHIATSKVITEAQIVASGIAEVARLQSKDGYVYLKP